MTNKKNPEPPISRLEPGYRDPNEPVQYFDKLIDKLNECIDAINDLRGHRKQVKPSPEIEQTLEDVSEQLKQF